MVDERSRKINHKAGELWGNFGLPFIFIIVLIVFSVQSPIFVSWRNLLSTMGFSSYIAIGAIGMTFIIMTGNFDISIGSMLALVAVRNIDYRDSLPL